MRPYFTIEHGFWNTPKGQKVFSMNLEQIKNAQIDALYASVIDALLKSKTVLDVFQQQYGKFITQNTLQRERVARVENWAILQKTNYGFDMLTSAACKALKLGGVTPDCWVVDDGVKQYVANVRRENFQYFLAGPRGQTMYESALGNKTGKAVDVASGLLIHEAKHFDLPDIEEPHNLLSRPRMIGEYNVMYPHMTPDASYNSDWRAILVYDEKRDGFRRIGLCDAINGCARWNHFGEIDFPDGFDSKDMFMKADGNPVRHFGDMDLDGLPRKARDDWVASVLNKLDDEIANDVEALVSLCEQLDPTDIDSVRSLSSDTKGKKGKVLEPVGPVPFGYGNAAGIDELSHEGYASVAEYKEYHQLAKKAMRALRTIKKVADSLTDEDHKLTDDEIVSSLIDKQLYPIIDMYGDDNEQTLYRKLSEFRSDRLTNDYAQQVINAPGFEFDDFLNFAFAPTYDGDHSAALDAPGQVVNGNLQKEAYLIGSDGSKLGETDETREIYEVFTDGLTFFKDLVRKKQLDKLDDARKNKIGQIIFALSLNIDSVDFYNLVSRLDESNLITFLKNVDINIQRGGKEEKEARFLELIKDADDRDVQNRNFKFSGLSSTKQLYQNVLRAFTVESSSYEANFQAALENMAFEEGEINLQGQRVTGARAGDTYGGSGKRRAVVKGGVLTIERGSGSGDAGDLYAKGKSKPVERFFHELLLKLPVTQQTLCMFAESDLVVPFNFILFRPRMTYRMSSGVCLKTGSSTGETLVGHADFQVRFRHFVHVLFFLPHV